MLIAFVPNVVLVCGLLVLDDWSRVKLTTVNHEGTSDYINANYMPVGAP